MTKLVNASLVVYALFMGAFGTYAFLAPREGHKASPISMVAGLAVMALMLTSLAIWKYKSPRGGRIMAAVVSVLCLGQFVPKAISNGIYPNGVLAIATGLIFVILLAGHFMARSEKNADAA